MQNNLIENVASGSATIEETNLQIPEILNTMLDNLEKLQPNLQRTTLLGMLLSSLSYTMCVARVQFRKTDNDKLTYPNLFTAFYLSSGKGKDLTTSLIKDNIFCHLKDFQNEQEKYYLKTVEKRLTETYSEDEEDETKVKEKVKSTMSKLRKFVVGSNSAGTSEGLYSDMKGYKERKTGAVFVQQSEAGAFAMSKSERKQDFLDTLYTCYDNRIEGRNLKDISYPTIDGVPVCAEFLSSPEIIKENANFRSRQTTALGRRIWVFMEEGWQKSTNLLTSEEYDNCIANLKYLGVELFKRISRVLNVNKYPTDDTLTLPDEERHAVFQFDYGVHDNCYIEYLKKCTLKYNNTEDELIRKSISEYGFRACKVACIYAVINHPDKFKITEQDFIQAISTVELTDGMATLVGFTPESKDEYDYAVNGIIEHLNGQDRIQISKTTLGKILENAIKSNFVGGRKIARKMLNKDEYEETKDILKQRLQEKGFDLISVTGLTSSAPIEVAKLDIPHIAEITDSEAVSELF